MSSPDRKIGLVLTGGGARAAYQVGVLKAIAELSPRRSRSPFQIICGTSSGALNAATLAINARQFRKGVQYLVNIWKNFEPADIYRTDVLGVLKNTLLWIGGLITNTLGIHRLIQVSMLDNTPLQELLEEALPCEKIQESIDAGVLHAVSVSASGYGSGQSVTFYQGSKDIQPWVRARRIGVPTNLDIPHLLASSALPFLFKAVRINREYFGDGSMRQIAPLSSALHLGATHIMVIGVGAFEEESPLREQMGEYPSLAHIAGHTLNSIFHDSMEIDLERIKRINHTLSFVPAEAQGMTNLRHVDVLVVSPSQPIEKIAEQHIHHMPWTINLLLRLVGVAGRNSGASLVSYLLSEKHFCQALIDLGYRDAMARKDEIVRFLNPPSSLSPDLVQ